MQWCVSFKNCNNDEFSVNVHVCMNVFCQFLSFTKCKCQEFRQFYNRYFNFEFATGLLTLNCVVSFLKKWNFKNSRHLCQPDGVPKFICVKFCFEWTQITIQSHYKSVDTSTYCWSVILNICILLWNKFSPNKSNYLSLCVCVKYHIGSIQESICILWLFAHSLWMLANICNYIANETQRNWNFAK